jgi:hypothetical protein
MSKSPPMQPTTQPAPNQRRPGGLGLLPSVPDWLGGAETEEELPFSSSVLHYGGRPFSVPADFDWDSPVWHVFWSRRLRKPLLGQT